MNSEFITNVYRELDPGTEYVLDSIATEDAEHIDMVFNIMIYRLMGSNISTHSTIGFQHHEHFSAKRFLRNFTESGASWRIFGDAYRVAGYTDYEGGSKIENIASLFKELATNLPEWYRRMLTSPTARDLYTVFKNVNGFGDFLANQCMVDVLMLDELATAPRWHFNTDTWTMAGPGARRGLRAMMTHKPSNLFQCIKFLRDAQEDEFTARGLQFPYLLNKDDSLKYLTVCNMQTSLCEFGKYVRSRQASTTRRYTSTPSQLIPYDTCLTEEQMLALNDIVAVTPAVSRLASTIRVVPEVLEIDSDPLESLPEPSESEFVPQLVAQPVSEAFGAVKPGQFDVSWLQSVLLGTKSANQSVMKPQIIPVDPTGLLGLPKAILIIPLD